MCLCLFFPLFFLVHAENEAFAEGCLGKDLDVSFDALNRLSVDNCLCTALFFSQLGTVTCKKYDSLC